jgi:DNA mismatch repair protein MutL
VKKDLEKAEEKPEQKIEPTFVEEKFLTAKVEEIKIVGVVFKTYIITEFEDSIYVVDQHAMHERQLYDKLKKQVEENNVSKQDMLVPYSFALSAKDRMLFESQIENLRVIGFEISQRENDFEISSVPFVLSNIKLDKFVEEILSGDGINQIKASQIINEKLCQTACKHAIRAGDSVSKEEICYLIEEMKGGVALCPHGRPIVVRMTKKELEKMFKRTL